MERIDLADELAHYGEGPEHWRHNPPAGGYTIADLEALRGGWAYGTPIPPQYWDTTTTYHYEIHTEPEG